MQAPTDMPQPSSDIQIWEQVEHILDDGNIGHLEAFLQLLPPGETAYTLNRLDEQKRTQLLSQVRPDLAAHLIEHLDDAHAADMIDQLEPQGAAAIVDELESDEQADILTELDHEDAEAILTHMDPAEARDARRLASYQPDTAGGIMISEYLVYRTDTAVVDVLADLRDNHEVYAEYDAQYVYAIDESGRLKGLIHIRDIVLSPGPVKLADLLNPEMAKVHVDDTLDQLEDMFDRHRFNAIPVVDQGDELVGVLRRAAVEEAHGEQADRALLRVGGIIAGEELRSMQLVSRSLRRLAYLVPNVLLMMISVSVIAMFEQLVLREVISLAIFLPLVAGVAGSAGNQAVAVSIRELSLGVAIPADVGRVMIKEIQVGMINGLVLAAVVFGIVLTMRQDARLAAAVSAAVPMIIVISVALGGSIPLILRRLSIDPAMASGPIITTLVDFLAFLFVLAIAFFMLI